MPSWIRGVVFDDFTRHESSFDFAWRNHPFGMGHLTNGMRKIENPSPSCVPHLGQDFRVLHQPTSSALMKLVSGPTRPLADAHWKTLPHAGDGAVSGLLVGGRL